MKLDLKYKDVENKETIIKLEWDNCVAAGYTGRDQKAVQAHIKELESLGIPAPQKVPAMYWIDPERVSTKKTLYVIGNKTSGEVEFFLAKDKAGELYVTVASDHTDRETEKNSVSKAKQICSKIVAENCWKVADICDHWDKIIISLKIRANNNSPEILYQEGYLGKIITPEKLEEICEQDNPNKKGNISILSGTLPLISDETIFAKIYQLTIFDPVLNRKIEHTYKVITLPDRS
jgi:hypothetical protein